MKMKKDLTDLTDIEKVVTLFYEKVKADDIIGFFFSEVIPIDWPSHLTLMCAFLGKCTFLYRQLRG